MRHKLPYPHPGVPVVSVHLHRPDLQTGGELVLSHWVYCC